MMVMMVISCCIPYRHLSREHVLGDWQLIYFEQRPDWPGVSETKANEGAAKVYNIITWAV